MNAFMASVSFGGLYCMHGNKLVWRINSSCTGAIHEHRVTFQKYQAMRYGLNKKCKHSDWFDNSQEWYVTGLKKEVLKVRRGFINLWNLNFPLSLCNLLVDGKKEAPTEGNIWQCRTDQEMSTIHFGYTHQNLSRWTRFEKYAHIWKWKH